MVRSGPPGHGAEVQCILEETKSIHPLLHFALVGLMAASTDTSPPLAAPFQWAAIFHKEDINFTNGHHDLTWYDPGEKDVRHKLPCKVSCSFCGSPIMDEGRNMILLYPTLIHFKSAQDKKNFEPS